VLFHIADRFPIDTVCQPCIQGKQTVEPVSKTTGRVVMECLELVHINLAGPSAVTGIDGLRYACTIKDAFSKYNWTSCLRTKDQAITFVQGWHKMALTQHPKPKVKAIRLDNGELESVAFVSWARPEGIVIEFTNPYTSAQNGIVEQTHRTLQGRSRAMRIGAGLPPSLWPEFYITAVCLANLIHTAGLPDGSTPHAAFKQKGPPDISHLRKISCKAFVLKQSEHNPKVFSCSVQGIFIGYDIESKAYRIWCPATRKIIVLGNVCFVESHQFSEQLWKPGQTASTAAPKGPSEWPEPIEAEGDAQLPPPLIPTPANPPAPTPVPAPTPPPPQRSPRLNLSIHEEIAAAVRLGEDRACDL
jgi:transposase InsO family protein